MDATQWPQVGLTRSMEEILPTNNPPPPQQQGMDSNNQRRVNRPQKDQNVNCPRCNSTNTKFCYYNNYSLTQPRYFCKACRRYWTQGGSLRNVPVGGGSRKNRRSTPPSSSSSASIAPTSSSSNMIPDLNPPPTNFSHMIPPFHHHQNPSNKIHPHPHHHGQDLNLAFPTTTMIQSIESNKVELPNSSSSPSPASFSALELLRTGMSSQFAMQDSNAMYTSSGFPNMHEMKPGLMGFPGPVHGLGLGPSFSVGGLQQTMMSHGNNNHQGSGGGAKLLFPFGDMNKFSSHQSDATRSDQADSHQSMKGSSQDHHQQQGASGYWNGMLGGGTW